MQITKVILSVILGAIAATNCFAQRSTINDARDAQAQKQGYYSYNYLLMDATGSVSILPSEGNFFETQNKYAALVYYRGIGERTDRLVAVKEIP